jgi:hypothetical protein
LGIGTGWVDANLNPSVPPSLPPGTGFFYYNPGATATNFTFVGQVVPGPSSTNSLVLQPGYSMIGSPLPANVADISAAPVSLPIGGSLNGLQILTWNGKGYVYSSYDNTLGIGTGWVDANLNAISAPSYSIGQGFFFYNPAATAQNWNQSLP